MRGTTDRPRRLVLLVEDCVVNQKMMDVMLQHEGCEVALATNGAEAVDMFKEQTFDLVLMDIQMPVMDGLEATRIMREHESTTEHHTPIIAVTAGMDRESCLKAGMDDHLEKPVHVETIHDVLSRLKCSTS